MKRLGIGDAMDYLKKHRFTFERYLRRHYTPYNIPLIRHFFMENPLQAKIILEDFKKDNNKKIEEAFRIFHSAQGMLIYVIGAKGAGKTATAFFFAEMEHRKYPYRKIYYIGKKFNQNVLPEWCNWAEKVQDVPNGAFGIIDEIGIQASARTFQSRENKDLSQILTLARQKKLPLFVLSQDARLGEVNVWRLRDIVIWKISNTYELQGRDSKTSGANSFWDKVKMFMKARGKAECLFEYQAKKIFLYFEHPLPDCWTDKLSEIYADAVIDSVIKTKKPKKKKDSFLDILN